MPDHSEVVHRELADGVQAVEFWDSHDNIHNQEDYDCHEKSFKFIVHWN